MKKNPLHYVDNEQFLESMIKYKNEVKQAKETDEPPPLIPEYLGECFLKIANRLAFRPNFINYAFRDEMVSDGIENCIQYMNNFNPEKSSNPFAYFTQIIYYAFIRRIEKEKKQLYIKYKTMDLHGSLDENVTLSKHDAESHGAAPMTADQKVNMYDFIATFESKKKKRKVAKKSKTTLEYFFVTA